MQSHLSLIMRLLLIAPTTVPLAAYAAMGIPIGLFGMLRGDLLFSLLLPASIGGLFGFVGLWVAVLTRGTTIMRKNLIVSIIYAVVILGITLVTGSRAPSKDALDILVITGITISLTACIVFAVDYLAKSPN